MCDLARYACCLICVCGGFYSARLLVDCWRQTGQPTEPSPRHAGKNGPAWRRIDCFGQMLAATTFLAFAGYLLTASVCYFVSNFARPQATIIPASSRAFGDWSDGDVTAAVQKSASGTIVGGDFTNSGICDMPLRRFLQEAPRLKWIILTGTRVSNDAMADLGRMPELVNITLFKTSISDSGLQHLGSLKDLEQLDLARTAITDEGLRHLTQSGHLQTLCLDETQVTDAGLVWLENLMELTEIDLRQTRVTRSGILGLRQALPKLSCVRWDQED